MNKTQAILHELKARIENTAGDLHDLESRKISACRYLLTELLDVMQTSITEQDVDGLLGVVLESASTIEDAYKRIDTGFATIVRTIMKLYETIKEEKHG